MPGFRRNSHIATFSIIQPQALERALYALRADLHSGVWEKRYGDLLMLDDCDFGYRLVCS